MLKNFFDRLKEFYKNFLKPQNIFLFTYYIIQNVLIYLYLLIIINMFSITVDFLHNNKFLTECLEFFSNCFSNCFINCFINFTNYPFSDSFRNFFKHLFILYINYVLLLDKFFTKCWEFYSDFFINICLVLYKYYSNFILLFIIINIFTLIFIYIFLRSTLPRYRVDNMLDFFWKYVFIWTLLYLILLIIFSSL